MLLQCLCPSFYLFFPLGHWLQMHLKKTKKHIQIQSCVRLTDHSSNQGLVHGGG